MLEPAHGGGDLGSDRGLRSAEVFAMQDLVIQQGPPPPPPEAPPRRRRWFMRPWFIITIALALLAGVAVTTTLLLSQPKTITVHGNVIDQVRPDMGVATATISTDGTTAKADATGAFKMTGVPEKGVLSVSAPYYRTNTVTASTRHLTIRLTPLPVALAVTSALTGAPLTAAISAPAGQPLPYTIASGGTVRLYRAGPGETLTVTANGYRPAHVVVRADRTLAVALEPTVRTVTQQFGRWVSQGQYSKIADWVLRPATGYTYLSPTPQEQAEMNRTLQREFELYATSRAIDGTTASVTLIIDKPGVTWDVPGTVEAGFGHASPVVIAGRKAWHGGPDSDGYYTTMMKMGQLQLMVFAQSKTQTDQVMTRIVSTLLGPRPSAST